MSKLFDDGVAPKWAARLWGRKAPTGSAEEESFSTGAVIPSPLGNFAEEFEDSLGEEWGGIRICELDIKQTY